MNLELTGRRAFDAILTADRIINEAFALMPKDILPSDQMKIDLKEFCEVVALIKMSRGL